MMANNLKEAFSRYLERMGLKKHVRGDVDLPGTCRLLRSDRLWVLELRHVSTCSYVPGRVGYDYPAGVRGLTSGEMVAWLEAHHG